MTDFDERLKKAIERGQHRGETRSRQAKEKALSEEELKSLHTKYRLELSEHIERCVRQLPDHFPGFRFQSVYGERGWGAACNRDDVGVGSGGKRANFYSRFEMTVRPFSPSNVLELTAKGTIRNKEAFNRTHFEKLGDVDPDSFTQLIDFWVLDYAELYAARP